MNKHHTQFGEDKILKKIFSNKSTGICVEVGGCNGVTGSNTYFFEKLGWRSVVVEPMLDFCQKIKDPRKCKVVEAAASSSAGEVEFYVAVGVETLSTIEEDINHHSRIKGLSTEQVKKIKVKTDSVEDILVKTGIREIDFLKIDVEGHDMSVLDGVSFEKISVRNVIIEDNSQGTDSKIDDVMKAASYIRYKRTGCNDWYIKKTELLVTKIDILQTNAIIAFVYMKRKLKGFLTSTFFIKLTFGVIC